MNNLFLILVLLSMACLIVGLIKPALVFRWGNPDKQTRKRVLTTYLGATIIFFIAFSMTMDTKNQPVQTSLASPEVKSAPVETTTQHSSDSAIEEKIKNIVKDKADAYYTETIIKKVGSDFVIEAHLKNLNYMFESTSMDVFKALYTSGLPINSVSILDFEDMVDKYGNSKSELAGKIDITKQTATKINWENSNTVDLFEVADTKTLSPALSKMLNQEETP